MLTMRLFQRCSSVAGPGGSGGSSPPPAPSLPMPHPRRIQRWVFQASTTPHRCPPALCLPTSLRARTCARCQRQQLQQRQAGEHPHQPQQQPASAPSLSHQSATCGPLGWVSLLRLCSRRHFVCGGRWSLRPSAFPQVRHTTVVELPWVGQVGVFWGAGRPREWG